MPPNLENSAVATGLEKGSFHFNTKERQCQKCSDYHSISLISRVTRVMLKILQARLKQYMNSELPDVQLDLEKAEEPEMKLPKSFESYKKQKNPRKAFIFAPITTKSFDCVDHNKLLKILKEMGIPNHLTCLWRNCIQVKN